MVESITRSSFLNSGLDESRLLKYVTEFSKDSLILSLAVGVLEIFARFKGDNLGNYLKALYANLKKKSDDAMAEYPEFAEYIKFYLGFMEAIKSFEKSSQAFAYIDLNTITNPQYYLNILEQGFRCIVAAMFDEKKEYKALLISNTGLETFRMLIFTKVVLGLGIQLDLHDITEKESYKNERIGEFPILNIYIWNSIYYLAYTEEMYQERYYDSISLQVKKGPFFIVSTKKNFQPVQPSPQPSPKSSPHPSIQPSLNYADTTQLLKEIINYTGSELLKHNQYSSEFSKFIGECIKNNQEIANIQILKKFINTVNINAIKPAPTDSEMEIFADTSISLENSPHFFYKMCSVCANNLSITNYPNTSHYNCGVCTSCAVSSNYCPRCRNQYSVLDRQILRLP